MALSSMTGFARVDGAAAGVRWSWEVKTVNARGLDIRLRLPPGFDALEADARRAIATALVRGTCFATLSLVRERDTAALRVNPEVLEALAAALATVAARIPSATPPSLDGLLALRGLLDTNEQAEDETLRQAAAAAATASLGEALAALVVARRSEGDALAALLGERIDRIAALVAAADAHPARRPAAIRARLEDQIRSLFEAAPALDPDRLHQEAMLLATRSDIREELDRLNAHVAAARGLLGEGGAVGRRLDFLAQEFGREANTLCAKSNDSGLTALGLELKVVVEQFREQVQNVE